MNDTLENLNEKFNIISEIEEVENEYKLLPKKFQTLPMSEHVVSTVIATLLQKVNRSYPGSIKITPEEAKLLLEELRETIKKRYGYDEETLSNKIRKAFLVADNNLETEWPELGKTSEGLE